MKIQSVAILGLGAIGGYMLYGLHQVLADHVYIIAKGNRKKRLEESGLYINDQRGECDEFVHYSLQVVEPQDAHGVDLLIVSCKYGALKDSLEDIKEIVDDHTIVMSLLNGVDSEEIISSIIPSSQIIPSCIKIASARENHYVSFHAKHTIGLYFGEYDGIQSERCRALIDLFQQTPLHYIYTQDIMSEMWEKFALNISHNLVQALLDCGLGAYDDSEHVYFLSQKLRDEVVAVAKAKGIHLQASTPSVASFQVPKNACYSTLQDLRAKRLTEIDMFSKTLMRYAQQLHMDVPYNTFIYHAIKALEEKNAGKFNYGE